MKKIDFIKYRYLFYAISLIVIITGAVFGAVRGFKFDIDFRGGTTIQADLKEEFDNNNVSKIVQNVTNSVPLVQKLSGGQNQVSITTDPISPEMTDEIIAKLKETFLNMDEPSTRNVQPAYGKELIESALIAIIVSIVLILLYITIRFKTLGFNAAVTAILALIHDALVLISIYAIFGLPINSTFVAVILTIIGYSINDTIIVYDRIRENKKKANRSNDFKDTINLSLFQTLKRTIYTSITTITAVVIIYVFAYFNSQQVLKEFSFPLIIGVITGTYSSMFIAPSLMYSFNSITKKFIKKNK